MVPDGDAALSTAEYFWRINFEELSLDWQKRSDSAHGRQRQAGKAWICKEMHRDRWGPQTAKSSPHVFSECCRRLIHTRL